MGRKMDRGLILGVPKKLRNLDGYRQYQLEMGEYTFICITGDTGNDI